MAAYQPQFFYSKVFKPGDVVSINGTYRAGTPINVLGSLVNGASGGGGNNYTGSSSSFDNFTACLVPNTVSRTSIPISLSPQQDESSSYTKGAVEIAPNPSRDFVLLSFVPTTTGISTITLSDMDGKKVSEINNGVCKAGNKYVRRIDVSRFPAGVYLVQLRGVDKTTVKKIIVSR